MHSTKLQFLHKDERKEMYKGFKKKNFYICFPNKKKSQKLNVYCYWLVVQRDRVTDMFSVLLYSILSVEIVYSVQLNCIDSDYRETEWL